MDYGSKMFGRAELWAKFINRPEPKLRQSRSVDRLMGTISTGLKNSKFGCIFFLSSFLKAKQHLLLCIGTTYRYVHIYKR